MLKNELVPRLRDRYDVLDLGAFQCELEDDYPDFAQAVAGAVASGRAERGIVICGSGVGACIAANKVPGIRACLCHDTYSAHQGVEHDDMNVLCLGARVVAGELAFELVTSFLTASFTNGPRFQRRLQKVLAMERRGFQEQAEGGTT
ncbi:MAG: ribose-5-phosphate isomerase [Chloroflexi bacterium RBG_16_57_8]|nr:MAG: ribose-5-phosphate isomerase [Chloroflexi bacterium RBG_16_57_8]